MRHGNRYYKALTPNRHIYVKILLFLCGIITIFYFFTDGKKEENAFKLYNAGRIAKANGSIPLIIGWTNEFGRPMQKDFSNCEYKCDFLGRETYERSNISFNPSSYIFHVRDIIPHDLPVRYTEQMMVFYAMESPVNMGKSIRKMPRDYFNASLTYRLDSDYLALYGKWEKMLSMDPSVEKKIESGLANKTRGALAFISNCDTDSKREDYVEELSKYTDVTVIGDCGGSWMRVKQFFMGRLCPAGSQCEKDFIATYRFYLSFENSICKDYITEKFFSRMQDYLVPVVLKGKIYNVSTVPVGSYIAADSFESPRKLGEYLNMLRHDDKEYMKYLDFHKYYKGSSSIGLCKLCEDIHKKKKRRIDDIMEFYANEKCDHNHKYTSL